MFVLPYFIGTMTSADFLYTSLIPQDAPALHMTSSCNASGSGIVVTCPRGKHNHFPLIYPSSVPSYYFEPILGFVLSCKLTQSSLPNILSVPRTRVCLEPFLQILPLDRHPWFWLVVRSVYAYSGLSPPSCCACPAHRIHLLRKWQVTPGR